MATQGTRVSQQLTAIAKLGRYDVVKHLADGGMAEVLLGRASGIEGFERHVVIKRIRADQARDKQFVTMFLDEARLAASLHHTNILQVHDIGEEGGEYFFTMEYLHGQDLRKLLKRATALGEHIPLEHVLTIVINAAAGLHFAHEHCGPDGEPLGIVHRDVSLSNIMVGYDGFVKVADFGIAKAVLRKAETHSGVLKGKVAYMSPEQCLGRALDRRSDVYSLGIVLYELATARRLYKADSDFLTMSAIVDGRLPPPSTLRPEIGPELDAIIMKALARRLPHRYATADALRVALEDHALAARMRTSATALAAYMKRMFGDQPEPWKPNAPLDIPDDSDFDGSQSGLVGPLTGALRELALPEDAPEASSPILRARTRITTQPPLSHEPTNAAVPRATAPTPAVKTGRWKWIGAVLVVVSAAAVAFVLATRNPEEPAAPPTGATPSQPAVAPPPQPSPPVASEPPRSPPATEPTAAVGSSEQAGSSKPVAAEPTASGEPVKSAEPVGSSADGSSVAAGSAKTVKPPPRRPPPPPPRKGSQQPRGSQQPKWDPDELLP